MKLSRRTVNFIRCSPLLLMFSAVAVWVLASMMHFSSGKDVVIDLLALLLVGPVLILPIAVLVVWAWFNGKN
jgi:hypothetical protein